MPAAVGADGVPADDGGLTGAGALSPAAGTIEVAGTSSSPTGAVTAGADHASIATAAARIAVIRAERKAP
jgi:hypothetical protein